MRTDFAHCPSAPDDASAGAAAVSATGVAGTGHASSAACQWARRSLLLVTLLTAFCRPALAMTVALPEPQPRLSIGLSFPAAHAAQIDDDERRLLRVEWRAGLSRIEETRAIDELLQRIGHMEVLVADIARGVQSLPDWRQRAPATPASIASADGSLFWMLTGAAALMTSLLLGVFWRRRQNALTIAPSAMPTVLSLPPEVTTTRAHKARATPAPPSPIVTALPAASAPAAPKVSPAGTASQDSEAVWLPPTPAPVPTQAVQRTVVTSAATTAATHEEHVETHHELSLLLAPDSTIELANIMLSMGLSKGAEDALMRRIQENPQHALYYWLKLLEVYRCSGMVKEFEHAAAKLHALYNVEPGHWQEGDAPAMHSIQLEDFRHIINQLVRLWPSPEARDYLEKLLADNREGTRNGFPQSVAEEMLLLIAVLEARAA